MIETHPFGSFVPFGAKYLLLGSFPTKEAFNRKKKESCQWFYSNGGRNQFWPILEAVYGIKLETRKEMKELFTGLGMALADIIFQCERKKNSNLDINLVNIVYAVKEIIHILENNPIIRIFFTSRYVETRFRHVFKEIIKLHPATELVTLPSPSPRYATITKAEKIKRYRELLPKMISS